MRKMIVGALLALTALAIASSTASAYPLTVSPGGAITVASLGRLSFRNTIGITNECNVSLIGTINRAIASGAVAGSITTKSVTNCSPNSATALAGTWNIVANGVLLVDGSGRLIGILGTLQNAAFQVSLCLYSGNIPILIAIDPVTGLTGLVTVLANSLPGGALCGTGSINAGQQFSISPRQTIRRV